MSMNLRQILLVTLALALPGCQQAPPTAGPTPGPSPSASATGAPVTTSQAASSFVGFVGEALAPGATGTANIKIFRLGQNTPIASGTTTPGGEFIAAFGADVPANAPFKVVATENGKTLGTIAVSQVIAAGAGNVIPAGAGNVIAAGGGNVIAAGGGNVIAAGGGNVIAAGGGNVIAAGAGNVIAAGAGNVIAAGAGNVIAAGAGNYRVSDAGGTPANEFLLTPATTLALLMLGDRFEEAGTAATTRAGGVVLPSVQSLFDAFSQLSTAANAGLSAAPPQTLTQVLTALSATDGTGTLSPATQNALVAAAPTLTSSFTQAAVTLDQSIATALGSGGTTPVQTTQTTFAGIAAPSSSTGSSGAGGGTASTTNANGNLTLGGTLGDPIQISASETALAGNGYPGDVDGASSTARFDRPGAIVAIASDTYVVADTGNNALRKMKYSAGDWTVTTMAGGGASGTADGTGSAARFNAPQGLAYDATAQVLYIADTGNNCIRTATIDAGTGLATVSTLAGSTSGTAGFSDATGTAALFNHPLGLAVDHAPPPPVYGNSTPVVYVADTWNNRVRRIDVNTKAVTTISGGAWAGNANDYAPNARLAGPSGVAVYPTGHDLYVADTQNNLIRHLYINASTWYTTSESTAYNGSEVNGWNITGMSFYRPTRIFFANLGSSFDGVNGLCFLILDASQKPTLRLAPYSGSNPGATLSDTGNQNYPTDATIDSNGHLIITDGVNNWVHQLSP